MASRPAANRWGRERPSDRRARRRCQPIWPYPLQDSRLLGSFWRITFEAIRDDYLRQSHYPDRHCGPTQHLKTSHHRWNAVIAFCALLFTASTVLAFYHVGVEQHWFAGPSACTGSVTGASSIEALKAQLLARQPVNCDEPAWRLFGISLAGWNLLASALITAFCLGAIVKRGRR